MRPLYSASEVESEFTEAMHAAGLATRDKAIADGHLHRVHVQGDRIGTTNAWYVLHLDGRPAGCFGSWKTGISGSWCAGNGKPLNKAEKLASLLQVRRTRELRAKAQLELHEQAARSAERIWSEAAIPSDDFPYLVRKGIKADGLRQWEGRLIVPVTGPGNELRGLQIIYPDGRKRFLRGTRKHGSFCLLGDPTDDSGIISQRAAPLLIAEGFATAATVHAATLMPVVVAFDAGNLVPVAMLMAAEFPHCQLVIAADNDACTPGNPGLNAAKAAAGSTDGRVVYPNFIDGDGGTDWNDYALAYGMAQTRTDLLAALGGRHGR